MYSYELYGPSLGGLDVSDVHKVVKSKLGDAWNGRVSTVGKCPVSVQILVHLARGDVEEQS